MKVWNNVGATAAVLSGGLLLGATGAPPPPSQQLPEGVSQEMVDQGREIFHGAGLCSVCHGEEGAGGAIGPDLTDQEWLHVDGSYGALVRVITEGVAQPKEAAATMPPKGGSQISDDQVRAAAAYVWVLSR